MDFKETYYVKAVLESSDVMCNETDIMLVCGVSPNEGVIQICLYGFWGAIQFSYYSGNSYAKVVCRQLGYDGRKLSKF